MTSEYFRYTGRPLVPALAHVRLPEMLRMKTHSRLFLCLLAPVMLAAAAGAQAQSCTNGNNIYHRKVGGFDVSCSQSSCHGNDAKANANGILNSGQQP